MHQVDLMIEVKRKEWQEQYNKADAKTNEAIKKVLFQELQFVNHLFCKSLIISSDTSRLDFQKKIDKFFRSKKPN